MENLIAVAENKFADLETKIIDVGNKITSEDKLFLRVTNETARQIHQRIPLPFQSRTRLNNNGCGFVKRAEAAQGFSHCVAKFPFTDRQMTGRLELLRAALAWTPVGQSHNMALLQCGVKSLV